ncbi:MAG: hypothetical protein GX127_04320 [Eubacteriaceae bacterium]|nr:hypothetical protein [Eubacteriaceae bacterium]
MLFYEGIYLVLPETRIRPKGEGEWGNDRAHRSAMCLHGLRVNSKAQ